MDCNPIFVSGTKRIILIFTLLISFLFVKVSIAQTDTTLSSSEVAIQEAEIGANNHVGHIEEEFDPTKVVMEHISDSHTWHVVGNLSLPLPVILYTNKGLDFFSSGHFHHGESDYTSSKYTYRLVDGEIKVIDAGGNIDESSSEKLLDFSITKNVAAMLFSVIVLLLVFTSVASSYKKRVGKAPKGLQSFIEPIILFVRDDIARPNIGHGFARFMPYLLTLFFFIWLNNLLGLVPAFPGGANLTGNIAVTFVLAVLTLIIVNVNGNRHYWKHILRPDVPWWLYPIMLLVELIGIISKPFALMIRLFANMIAGHIIVLSLISLIFIFETLAVAPVSIAFVLFMYILELLVGFLQAFIFTLLTALFIGMAVEEHH